MTYLPLHQRKALINNFFMWPLFSCKMTTWPRGSKYRSRTNRTTCKHLANKHQIVQTGWEVNNPRTAQVYSTNEWQETEAESMHYVLKWRSKSLHFVCRWIEKEERLTHFSFLSHSARGGSSQKSITGPVLSVRLCYLYYVIADCQKSKAKVPKPTVNVFFPICVETFH